MFKSGNQNNITRLAVECVTINPETKKKKKDLRI